MFSLATVDIQLDKKAVKKDGKHPIKPRITHQRQPRYYQTPYNMTAAEYEKAYSLN